MSDTEQFEAMDEVSDWAVANVAILAAMDRATRDQMRWSSQKSALEKSLWDGPSETR